MEGVGTMIAFTCSFYSAFPFHECEFVYLFVSVFVHMSLQSTLYMSEIFHSATYMHAF